ncbi:MAG: DUF378 domain-containing protein [Defluviitaleaceae bacterium]|nr:DUF378 domain-containing protein [Defluviitaleaceae bacterium]
MRSRTLDWVALTCLVIGAINLGLIGFFQFDLIAMVFGGTGGWFTRLIYAVIGLAGLYSLSLYARLDYDNVVRDEL